MNEAKRKVAMPTSKQPGQVAFEAFVERPLVGWDENPDSFKCDWARVEAAVRADERAKIREALAELKEFLQDRHDAESFSDGSVIPNSWMRASQMLERALALPQPVVPILDAAQDPDGYEDEI